MKDAAKVLTVALASIVYGIMLVPVLVTIFDSIFRGDGLTAGTAFIYMLIGGLPGLAGAAVVYTVSRRARDDRLTALTWASVSAMLVLICALIFGLDMIQSLGVPGIEHSRVIAVSIAVYILVPALMILTRRLLHRKTPNQGVTQP